MGAIVLGKMHLRWCKSCGVPVLEDAKCGRCGANTTEVILTPPGDARPAFRKDVARLRDLIDAEFGKDTGRAVLSEGAIALLNKAPDIDRTDEVIVGGAVVGARRYSLLGEDKFLPRPSSAASIAPLISKNWVAIDRIAATAIREKKASTLAVGVDECSDGIKVGAEVIVLDQDELPVSVGMAKMTSEQMRDHPRGTAVKTRWAVQPDQPPIAAIPSRWEQVVEANANVISRRAEEAKGFIREMVNKTPLPVAVSYSGGKDSLATLLLALDSGIRPALMFVDTGLEFAQTKANVSEVASRYGLDLLQVTAGESFWKNLPRFGPPARDFRWCCKTCKLGPATQLIQTHFPHGVLSLIGQRAYESQQRSQKGRVWRNPWTPNQLAASPIQKWTALHVWLYLMSKDAPTNSLYEEGLERIGCFMCPASDLAELRLVREVCPEYKRWTEYLESYAQSTGKPKEWERYDLWRWKRIPRSVIDEMGGGIEMPEVSGSDDGSGLEFHSTSGYNPCVEGLSMEGIFSKHLDMTRVANLMNIAGRVTTSPDMGIAEASSITVFREGPVMIKAKDETELGMKGSMIREIVLRATNCAGCGICIARCPIGALSLDGQATIDEGRCTHCRACLGPCPAVSFRPDQMDI